MKSHLITIVKQILEGTDSSNENIALKAHDSLVEDCNPIDRYYVIKALKTASDKNSDSLYYDWAQMTVNSKHGNKSAFRMLLDEIYNISDAKQDDAIAARAGMGNLDYYTEIITDMIGY